MTLAGAMFGYPAVRTKILFQENFEFLGFFLQAIYLAGFFGSKLGLALSGAVRKEEKYVEQLFTKVGIWLYSTLNLKIQVQAITISIEAIPFTRILKTQQTTSIYLIHNARFLPLSVFLVILLNSYFMIVSALLLHFLTFTHSYQKTRENRFKKILNLSPWVRAICGRHNLNFRFYSL